MNRPLIFRSCTAHALRVAWLSAACAAACAAAGGAPHAAALEPPPPAGEYSVADLRAQLAAGSTTSVGLTRDYLARIAQLNPRLHAVIAVNPHALEDAGRSDARRAAGRSRGPLDGIPILLKDNIDYAGGLPTTAGSLALVQNQPRRNAPLVGQLLDGGAIVLGKTNLSEWANMRSDQSSSGWSAVGGLTHNPYVLDRSACGSSSGSAAALAANLVPLAVGTETDGSITCPAAANGLVGLKPTVGLVSRAGIVPISVTQDTAGPMARSVSDAALLLNALALPGPHRADFTKGLQEESLRGVHLGVLRFPTGFAPQTLAVFDAALDTLRARGAVLVDINEFDFGSLQADEMTVLLAEFKVGLNAYLASTPPVVKTRSMDALIEFNRATPRELEWFGQDLLERAAKTSGLADPIYLQAHRDALRHAGPEGIDRLLAEHHVAALVAPTGGPAWTIDLVNGDAGGGSSTRLPAVAGYPHLTVPMGQIAGLPVGLSFIGAAWTEAALLAYGYAFEAAAQARHAPRFLPALDEHAAVGEHAATP